MRNNKMAATRKPREPAKPAVVADQTWDIVIRQALVFDGSGALPRQCDVAIKDGRVAAIDASLPSDQASSEVDARGQWLMPGLIDIHTHLDLEVELDPRLPEVVRHGTTTVVVGNCSLGVAFGAQTSDQQNPIVDCFTRVENIPKTVLQKCVDKITWKNTAEYLDHFEQLPLGPNIAALLPHSMLRVEVMGLDAAISREPTESELQKMSELLSQAMEQGYVGMSTDGLPFHYLANDPHKDKRIPTQFAKHGELKRLLQIVRDRNRVWQATPFIENKALTLLYFAFTSGLLFGKTLKTSALAAIDFVTAPQAVTGLLRFAKLMNSKLFRGRIHFQALSTPFRLWGDGVVSPMFEELESTAQLIAKEYADREGRRALLNDPAFIRQFRADWYHGLRGFSLARFKTMIGFPENNVVRDIGRMHFDGAPVDAWNGESLKQVFDRLRQFQNGQPEAARNADELAAFKQFPLPTRDDAEFMLHLLREYDKGFRWWVDVANVREQRVRDLLFDENTLPGFNDSGAHLTNLAFFDGNLLSLQVAQKESEASVAHMVKRLTSEPAEFFGINAGRLAVGSRADIILVDPEALRNYDTIKSRELVYRDIFEHQQMVNRSDGVVTSVYINGERVFGLDGFTDVLGSRTLGQALRAA
jgi:N-acyl-D-aspartate/D-glutamate deacylase